MRLIAASLFVSSLAAAAPLPAHYAPLFEKGKTWVYDTRHITFGPDIQHPFVEKGHVACKVVEVKRHGGATVSHITCDQDLGRKFDLAGWWRATDKGLARIADDGPAPDANLIVDPEHEIRIAAQPKVFENIIHDAMAMDRKHDRILVGVRESPKIAGWCVYQDTTDIDPDGGHVSICYAPGIGIQSGYDDVGGSLDRLEWTVR